MKTTALILALASVLTTVSAHAAIETRIPSKPSVPSHQVGNKNPLNSDVYFCPQISQIEIITVGASLDPKSMNIHMGGQVTEVLSTGSTDNRVSDMPWSTDDTFSTGTDDTEILVTRNDDGQYPTHSMPGHNSMTIIGTFAPDRRITCMYSLK